MAAFPGLCCRRPRGASAGAAPGAGPAVVGPPDASDGPVCVDCEAKNRYRKIPPPPKHDGGGHDQRCSGTSGLAGRRGRSRGFRGRLGGCGLVAALGAGRLRDTGGRWLVGTGVRGGVRRSSRLCRDVSFARGLRGGCCLRGRLHLRVLCGRTPRLPSGHVWQVFCLSVRRRTLPALVLRRVLPRFPAGCSARPMPGTNHVTRRSCLCGVIRFCREIFRRFCSSALASVFLVGIWALATVASSSDSKNDGSRPAIWVGSSLMSSNGAAESSASWSVAAAIGRGTWLFCRVCPPPAENGLRALPRG